MSTKRKVDLTTYISDTRGSAARKAEHVNTNVKHFAGKTLQSPHQKDVINAQTEIAASYRNAVGDLLTHHFIADRKHSDPRTSYTAFLAQADDEELSRILIDEAVQLAMRYSESDRDNEEVIKESADLFYNLLVMLERRGLSMSNITEEVVARVIDSGYKTAIFEKLYNGILTEQELLDYLVKNKIGGTSKVGTNVAFNHHHQVWDAAPKKLVAKPKKLVKKAAPKKLVAKPKKLVKKAAPKKLVKKAAPKKLVAKPKKLATKRTAN